jgi:hypothetical protein
MKTLKESILKSVKAGKHAIDNIIKINDISQGIINRNNISLDYVKAILAQIVASNPEITKAVFYYNIHCRVTPQMIWFLYINGSNKSCCSLIHDPKSWSRKWTFDDEEVQPGDPEYKIVQNIKKTLDKIEK